MNNLGIEKQDGEGATIFLLEGRLDTNTSPELENVLLLELDSVGNVTLDLEKLEYISSAGLRVLLSAQKKASAENGGLRLVHVCSDVMDVLDMTGFVDILTIE